MLGLEITGDAAYEGRSMARVGLPSAPEVEITGAALNSLLDTLDGHFG
jgi:hypothetical protein